MLGSPSSSSVYIVLGHVDMRKSFDTLAVMVERQLSLNPLGGSLFAFSNRRRTVVKLLYWDKNGFAIWHKRLEKERFRWPESRGQVLEVGVRELRWLLDGLNLQQLAGHQELSYAKVY